MDIDHFASTIRSLTEKPSRRAVNRALAGLAAGSVLAPLIGLPSVEAKKKKGRKKKQKNKNKKTLSPAPPPPPPPRDCPPVCPICQTCNTASALCEPHFSQQGQPAPGCEDPQLCCGGSCCHPIHECNSAGTCATCAQACPPAGCATCVNLADGSTLCAFDFGHRCDLNELCSASTDCPFSRPDCATSLMDRNTNTPFQICGQPVGSGVCIAIGGCGA